MSPSLANRRGTAQPRVPVHRQDGIPEATPKPNALRESSPGLMGSTGVRASEWARPIDIEMLEGPGHSAGPLSRAVYLMFLNDQCCRSTPGISPEPSNTFPRQLNKPTSLAWVVRRLPASSLEQKPGSGFGNTINHVIRGRLRIRLRYQAYLGTLVPFWIMMRALFQTGAWHQLITTHR
jgi:hypothetical protein